MAEYAATASLADPDLRVLDYELERALLPFKGDGELLNVHALREELMDIMWDDVGVMRDKAGLARGLERVESLQTRLLRGNIGAENRVFNLTWHDWLNLYNLIEISLVITRAALARENSRGAHFREDYPEPGSLEESYFTQVRLADEKLTVEQVPVEFTIIKPGQSLVENYTETAPKVHRQTDSLSA